MQLGMYTSFCKLNNKGNMRKVNKYSYLAVEDWGKKGLTIDFVNKRMKQLRSFK